ncbi:5'-(N(7)-methyl 5'-triphosphoguanosine)-(mRNA) diphosphatase [Martiniozyma asiatica (nom. inval.)]|nr:5'-(N(7)-methyl 5'-triphosphoguanosine)-(mRNA) diphosphatase [Martiniozyma asiatica]
MDKIEEFKYQKTLAVDTLSKRIVLLGNIGLERAILTLEKTAFPNTENVHSIVDTTELIAHNDIYYWAMATLKQDLKNSIPCKVNLIYPATETHIKKYETPVFHMVKETPQAYIDIVKPYIDSMRGDRLKWVRNILYDGAEADRVVYKNNDFVVLPDMKWDGKDVNSLYCCAIVFNDNIYSIRDLNESHLEWLESIQESLLTEVVKKYKDHGIQRDSLRLYVHYQPSYYHFHIHIVNVNFSGLPASMAVGKAILLNDVIEDLKLLGKEGYMKKTLVYALSDKHDLWERGLKNYTP